MNEQSGDRSAMNPQREVEDILAESFGENPEQDDETETEVEELTDELDDQEDDQDESEEDDQGASTPESADTLQDIWKASGFDPAELYDLDLVLSDGSTAKLGALKDEVQAAHQLKTQLETDRQQLEQERAVFQQQAQQALTHAAALPQEAVDAQAGMRALADRYNDTNWDALKQNDPGKAALLKQEMEESFQAERRKYDQAVQQAEFQRQQQQMALMHTERAKTVQLIPEWEQEQVRTSAFQAGKSLGFQDHELAGIADHRIMVALHKLAKYEAAEQQAGETLGKPKPVKRVLKPGVVKNRKVVRNRKLQAKHTAAKNGTVSQKTDYIAELLNSGA